MKPTRLTIFTRIFVFTVLLGIIEDFIAIKLGTDAIITTKTIIVIVIVAIVFAYLGELLVDKTSLVCQRENISTKRKKRK